MYSYTPNHTGSSCWCLVSEWGSLHTCLDQALSCACQVGTVYRRVHWESSAEHTVDLLESGSIHLCKLLICAAYEGPHPQSRPEKQLHFLAEINRANKLHRLTSSSAVRLAAWMCKLRKHLALGSVGEAPPHSTYSGALQVICTTCCSLSLFGDWFFFQPLRIQASKSQQLQFHESQLLTL